MLAKDKWRFWQFGGITNQSFKAIKLIEETKIQIKEVEKPFVLNKIKMEIKRMRKNNIKNQLNQMEKGKIFCSNSIHKKESKAYK